MTGGPTSADRLREDAEPADRVRRSPAFWLSRASDVGLLVPVVAVLFDPRIYDPAAAPRATLQWTLLWFLLGIVYIVVRIRRARRARFGDRAWPHRLNGRVMGYLVIAATAVMLVSSGLTIALQPVLQDVVTALPDPLVRDQLTSALNTSAVVALPTVFVAWAVLHLSYAERYARLWLRPDGSDGDEPPITFPGTPHPTFLEFVYFSFTVGVSVATSDCGIRSDHVRGVVVRHAILSFLYSTVILGIVIGLVG